MSGVELEMLVDSGATNNTDDEENRKDLKAKKIKSKSDAHTSSKPLEVKGCFVCEILVGKQRTQQRTATIIPVCVQWDLKVEV